MATTTTELEVSQALSDAATRLHDRIASRQAVVAVIGLGYVGLPLVVAFAEAGFRVVGLDVSTERVELLCNGASPIPDVPSESLGRLLAPLTDVLDGRRVLPGAVAFTTDDDVLADVDVVIICVPTPLNGAREPDVSFIESAADEIALRVHPGLLVVLESTSYPGTTEELLAPRLEQPGLVRHRRHSDPAADASVHHVIGEDVFLAFSPERIDPGRTDFDVRTTPKVVGGTTPTCTMLAASLYGTAVEQVVPVRDPRTAEMVKLHENTFRLINIALANELALMCERIGVDVWEVIAAASTKPFGFMPFYPGPGLGGHCIPIDPLYLSWKLRSVGYEAHSIDVAAEINELMPRHVVEQAIDALNDEGKALHGSQILVVGAAYKPDVNDPRESPAVEVIALLLERGAQVSYHDEYLPRLAVGDHTLESVPLDAPHLAAADCVVVVTPHSYIDWTLVAGASRLVVDTRNALARAGAHADKVVTL
jgi:UDP-N-acetyl-D-glucosamine dehydrogenase